MQFVLVDEALRTLRALAVERAGEPGDLQPQVGDQRGVARQLRLYGSRLGLGAIGCGPGLIGALCGLVGSEFGGRQAEDRGGAATHAA